MRIVSGLSNVSVKSWMVGSQVGITTKLVSRPYLDIQVKKTKDAAAVSLHQVGASDRLDSILFQASSATVRLDGKEAGVSGLNFQNKGLICGIYFFLKEKKGILTTFKCKRGISIDLDNMK